MSTTRTFSTLNHFILWFGASISIAEIVAPDAGTDSKTRHRMPKLADTMLTDSTDLAAVGLSAAEQEALIAELTGEMLSAAEALEFERAADLRDRIKSLLSSGKKEK